jgi:hypothetical protein
VLGQGTQHHQAHGKPQVAGHQGWAGPGRGSQGRHAQAGYQPDVDPCSEWQDSPARCLWLRHARRAM